MSLSENISKRVADANKEAWPVGAGETAVRSFADCIGVMLGGWKEPVTEIVRRRIGVSDSVPPFGLGITGPEAALIYGTAAHALDFDDTGLGGHPSAVLVPALLAAGLELKSSGRELISAYIAGYEVWAELWRRDPDSLHEKGWHPTAVLGTIAAAAAVACLHGESVKNIETAIGIAASFACGIVANFGSMTKPLQVGRAAANGLEAVKLAQLGITASPDSLDHDVGFLRALSPKDRVDRHAEVSKDYGRQILKHGTNIKLYPICYAAHRVIDAALTLRSQADWRPEDISLINVEIGSVQAKILRHNRPQTVTDAKFSLEFALTAALIAGRVGSAELTDQFIRNELTQALFAKVRSKTVLARDPDDPTHSPYDRVAIELKDGRQFNSGPVAYARGHFRHPAPLDSLRAKFLDCARLVFSPEDARDLFDTLHGLPRIPNIQALSNTPERARTTQHELQTSVI